MKRSSLLTLLAAVLLLAQSRLAFAQAPGVTIQSGEDLANDRQVIHQAQELKKAGKLLSGEKVARQLKKPTGEAVELEPAGTVQLDPAAVAERARKAYVRIGWFYLCSHCDHWHVDLAGGYAIDKKGAVATCYHCVEPDKEMREGYLVAVDDGGKVFAVSSIIAARNDLDTAVVKIQDSTLTPLPLQDQIVPGDAAFLYSEPFGIQGYFSSGIVNRFYWTKGTSGDPMKLDDAVRLRLNVSTEWAPGSSGAAVLDSRGNAIGHVSTIETLGDADEDDENDEHSATPPTMIAIHEAIPARGVMLLLKSTPAPAAKP